MREDFIAFIWKHQYFKKDSLQTSQNEPLQVLKVGDENSNAGPDFFAAQIIIDNQKWVGTVELHVKSSDWYVHGHENDANYDNVILHVVWEDDTPVFRKGNLRIATLELSEYVSKAFINNYQKLFSKKLKWINCENEIASVDSFLLKGWLERLYFERLEQKSIVIQNLLKQSKNNWEAVLFQLLAKNFGLKVNGEAFFDLARNIDFSIVRKEAQEIQQIEAFLFGQAALLNAKVEDGYYQLLQSTYAYQSKKYKLKSSDINRIQFFRLRPNNFPTIRLAQLAKLYHDHQNLFSKVIKVNSLESYYEIFNISASSFWDTHYTFETASKKRKKHLTKSFIDLLLINTIIPMRFIYQKSIGRSNEEEILNLINAIKSEKNSIIEKFSQFGIQSDSAFSSQSLLQLKNEYCQKYRCLQCSIGNKLLTK